MSIEFRQYSEKNTRPVNKENTRESHDVAKMVTVILAGTKEKVEMELEELRLWLPTSSKTEGYRTCIALNRGNDEGCGTYFWSEGAGERRCPDHVSQRYIPESGFAGKRGGSGKRSSHRASE